VRTAPGPWARLDRSLHKVINREVFFKAYNETGQLAMLLPSEVIIRPRRDDHRVTVALDAKAKAWVAEKGYAPVFGARPLKRFLQRHLETKLARALIAGEVEEDTKVTFKLKGDALVLV